jgi:micrococcal nuclease
MRSHHPKAKTMWEYKASIDSVYDGDTVTLTIDLYKGIAVKDTVRILGIDTPEMKTGDRKAEAKAARDFLRGLLPVGSIVTIKTHKDKTEKYGRLLGEIFLADGRSVGPEMIAAGHAVGYDGGAKG